MNLDDPNVLKLDKLKMYEIVENFPEHCERAIEISKNFLKDLRLVKPRKIATCGMGGSAIGGDLLKNWLPNLDIKVIRGYELPEYVDKGYLLFAVSYSGNTEETLSVFNQAVKRGIKIIAISSNGKLEKLCKKKRVSLIKIPTGMPPRSALPYLFLPMVIVLEKVGVVKKGREIKDALKVLKKLKSELKPEVKTSKNISKQIALKLKGKIPVIYGFDCYEAVAYRAKTQFNENSKVPSFSENFPELNHNAILGWLSKDLGKSFCVIIIRDKNETSKMKKRIEFTKKVISKSGASIIELRGRGKTKLAKMLSLIYILDFASIYLAFLYKKDPSDTQLISELKRYIRE
jgi:glucose/mannose-6-phosphate isomerase